jgi:uncharacterized protein (TIGR02444 family)
MAAPGIPSTIPEAPTDADRLWDFSCGLYAMPGVRELCLDWQERFGADIPLLLALCWQAARGQAIPDTEALGELARSLAPWREATVLPLRHLRQRLKPLSPPGSLGTRLRAVVLRAELRAERVQLAHLARTLPLAPCRYSTEEGTRSGLGRFLETLGLGPAERTEEAQRLMALIMPDDPVATNA